MVSGFEKLDAVVFRDATDPILLEDLNGIVIDLNEEAERTYGFSVGKLQQRDRLGGMLWYYYRDAA